MKIDAKSRLMSESHYDDGMDAWITDDVENPNGPYEQKAELTEKQKQLDINQDGEIDGEDLRRLRNGEKPQSLEASSVGLAQHIQKKLSSDLVAVSKIITMGPTATFAYDWDGVEYGELKNPMGAISKFIDVNRFKPTGIVVVTRRGIEIVSFRLGSYAVILNLTAATVTVIQS